MYKKKKAYIVIFQDLDSKLPNSLSFKIYIAGKVDIFNKFTQFHKKLKKNKLKKHGSSAKS